MRRPQWTASGAVTSVGSNGRASSYGTYDMAGNAPEIVTVVGSNPPRVMASVVGGGITDTGISDCISADSAAIHHTGCGGFRLACAVSELIPIKEPRKHAPLERIEALLRNVLTCLDDVIEGPADQVTVNSLQSIRKRLHGVEVQAQANSAGTSLLAITREARELLDAIGEDVVKRDTCLDQVAATARVASALMDVEGVRILAEADKLEIYSQFKCEYLPHQEKAKNLRDAARNLLPENLPAAP